jgi:hypothetical protein
MIFSSLRDVFCKAKNCEYILLFLFGFLFYVLWGTGFSGALFGCIISFFGAPIVSLADSTTISMLGESKHRYEQVRLWGAVGWGLIAPLAGVIIQKVIRLYDKSLP